MEAAPRKGSGCVSGPADRGGEGTRVSEPEQQLQTEQVEVTLSYSSFHHL